MKILKFVHGLEFDDVQTIWKNAIGLALEEMFGLKSSDMRNGGENVSTMGSASLYTIAMIDAPLACLVIDVKILKIVVEIHASCAEIAAKKCGVCCEDGCDIDVTLSTEGNSEACLPFVEMGNDRRRELSGYILREIRLIDFMN